MFNLVIKMDEGNIYEIVWDNGCFVCEPDLCEKDLPYRPVFENYTEGLYQNCFEPERNNTENLEPKFYITWFGTDKDKRQLKTAGLAMTKFKPYISSSFYSSFKGLFYKK